MTLDEANFTRSDAALSRVAKRVGSADKAKLAILEDLLLGHLLGIGVAQQATGIIMLTRDPSLDGLVIIPPTFWSQIDDDDRHAFDWEGGRFASGKSGGLQNGSLSIWKDVRFETARLDDVGKKKSNRGRQRRTGWDDWIAALVIIAMEGKLRAGMGDSEMHTLVSEQMGLWDIEEMPRGTVYPTMAQVLRRLEK